MKIGLEINIDFSKIDKSRLVAGKNEAMYLDLTTFIDIYNPSEFGSHGFVTQKKLKSEDKQTRLPILGNSKVFWTQDQQANHEQGVKKIQDNLEGDVPF